MNTARPEAGLGINLRHLRALTAVAAAGSITGAADALFRVPSGVTRAIANISRNSRPVIHL